MTISELIESSRRRDEAATKGPWFRAGYTNYSGYSLHTENAGCVAERWQEGLNKIEEQRLRDTGEFIAKARTSEPLFREIAAVAVEALKMVTKCEGVVACEVAREALSKIQSLIDEAEKK